MHAVLFDTLKLARRFQGAGIPAQQADDMAEALADAMQGQVATKADLQELEFRLSGEIAATRADLRQVEIRLSAEVAGVRSELTATRAELKGDIAKLEERIERRGAESDSRMVRWVVGTGITGVLTLGGIIVAAAWKLLQVLPH